MQKTGKASDEPARENGVRRTVERCQGKTRSAPFQSQLLARRRFFPAWTAARVSAMISRMGTAPKFVVGTSGRREAVLLDMNQYRRMLQKLEDLEDALALDRAERTSKKLVPYEDVRRRLKRAGKL